VRRRPWGSRLVEAGPLGHINAASGLGEWRQGLRLYEELLHILPGGYRRY